VIRKSCEVSLIARENNFLILPTQVCDFEESSNNIVTLDWNPLWLNLIYNGPRDLIK